MRGFIKWGLVGALVLTLVVFYVGGQQVEPEPMKHVEEAEQTEIETMVLDDDQETFYIGDTVNNGSLNITITDIEKDENEVKLDVVILNISDDPVFTNTKNITLRTNETSHVIQNNQKEEAIQVNASKRINFTLTFDISGVDEEWKIKYLPAY